jgi:hypothetical protein
VIILGKITDAAIAIIVIIVGIWVLSRLGLTLPAIEKMFRTFFFPSSGSAPTNVTASLVVGVASTSKLRKKIQEKEDDRKRSRFIHFLLSRFKRRGDA